MKNIVYPYFNQTIFGGGEKKKKKTKKKKKVLRQSLDWRPRKKDMVKWLRIPLGHIQSGFVPLFTLSPNLWYRNAFNRGNNCRDQEHFSVIHCFEQYVHLHTFLTRHECFIVAFGNNVASCHWLSLCRERLIEEQTTEEDVSENTSSPSEATSTLCFVSFPTTAASYLSY